jgi:hypothetical protein
VGVFHTIHEIERKAERIMANLANLEASVARLTDAVTNAVTALEQSDDQPAIDQLTGQVDNAVDQLTAAVASPAPAPDRPPVFQPEPPPADPAPPAA